MAQLIMTQPVDSVERILQVPCTRTWHIDNDGSLRFVAVTNDWHDGTHQSECFVARTRTGDSRFTGALSGAGFAHAPRALWR